MAVTLPIGWDERSYLIGGERGHLVSGEFHYFRVPKGDWRRRLRLWREAGGNAVATYFPWILHEVNEGEFDFASRPWLEVEAFLGVCQEEGMAVLARPGPYQYSELRYAGLPGWLFEKYPQVAAMDLAGKAISDDTASYLHPLFLEKVGAWFDRICPLLARFSAVRGGPVSVLQFDNELMGIHLWRGGPDCNAETMGFGREEGRYAMFLRQRYGAVGALNEAYATTFGSFGEVRPLGGKSLATVSERRRSRDYMHFYFSSIGEYAGVLMRMMRERGLEGLPFVHNSANPNMNAYFVEMMGQNRGQVLLGSDHYYTLGQEWGQNNPTPQYASQCFSSLEMLRLMGCPPSVFEMPGGSCSQWPPVMASDLKTCYFLHAALGMKGVNYYIFTGGPNPPGVGLTTDDYDYDAAIGSDGTIRPLYEVQKEFAEFLHGNAWLTEAWQEGDFYMGMDWEQARASFYVPAKSEMDYSPVEAWEFWRRGVWMSAQCGSWSATMQDLGADDFLGETDKPLWVATADVMARGIQERLVRFVEGGGRLIVSPVLPSVDEDFRPCTVLRDFLGAAKPVRCTRAATRINVGPVQNVSAGKPFVCEPPAGAERIASEEFSDGDAGWMVRYAGGGSVIWLGVAWNHGMHEHSRMVGYVLGLCGVGSRVAECSNASVWTTVRTDGRRRMLFVMNLFTSAMEARIRVGGRDGSYEDLGLMVVPAMTVRPVLLGGS